MPEFSLSKLNEAVQRAALIRIRLGLLPAAADGLVFPPTYDEGQHLFRPAWIDGARRDSVVLDTPQSQANRIELALLEAHRRGDLAYPDIEIVVEAPGGTERYSVLQLSHRIYDASLRLALIDGVEFPKSPFGKAVYAARADKATALFTHAPVTLVLGGWDSHGGGGPLVAKLPRLLTSEIIGLDAQPVRRGAVKFDPMDIRKSAGPLYESEDAVRMVETDKARVADKKKPKELKPSEAGLGNVPSMEDRGAVITEAVQTSLVSLAALRRLRFEKADGGFDERRDQAGRAALAALGLYGLLAQMESGYYLRSGCDLIPREAPQIEVIGASAAEVATYTATAPQAREILRQALQEAGSQGLAWRGAAIVAQADERLTTLIQRSRVARAVED